ncbi:MAG: LuxR C-terminal-related transcriptional regulator, partial [Candidatus Woesearchaeota archaeon]
FVWLAPEELTAEFLSERLPTWLEPQAGSLVMVVDDAERVDPIPLAELVEALTSARSRGGLVALASRTDPPLPIGSLRARRKLLELRAGALALTAPEAAAALSGAGLDIDFESVQALVDKTEGWPTGLFLAALSLRAKPDPGDGIPEFGGSDHLVAEYFRDEVLARTPPELLRFELEASVLDELSAPVCEAVLGREGSAAMLSRAARHSQFLVPIDRAHERYRWHPLFRESLERELRCGNPRLAARLHMRASAWLQDHGEVERAIGHAVAADDEERAGALIWDNLVRYVTSGQGNMVRGWLSRFGERRVASHPQLALAAAHIRLFAGDADEAQRWRTASAAASDDLRAERRLGLEGGAAVADAWLARGGVSRMLEAAGRARTLTSELSPWHPLASLISGVALHLDGDYDQAREALALSAELAGSAQPTVAALALAHGAMVAMESKDWEVAEEMNDRALTIVRDHGLGHEPILSIVFAGAAASRARSRRPDEAKQNLRQAIELLTDLPRFVPWYGALTRLLLGHASIWLADVVRARTLLAEASRNARRTPDAAIFGHWFDEAWEHLDTLAEASLSGPSALTIAELRILRFLPSHRSFREIGLQLGVSANTVKTHAHAIYRKLGAASRSEAVMRAREAGLIEP